MTKDSLHSIDNALKILVVDDSKVMRSYVSGALKNSFKCQIDEASSGFEALRLLPRNDYSVVISDINMPDINGLELIKFVRNMEYSKDIPIVVISTQSSLIDIERAKSLGASDFLSKPFSPEAISHSVSALLNNKDQSS